jgi:hypothetical protein
VLPNFTWSKSFLPGHAYPMSESSWHLCVYPWLSYYVRQRWDRFQHLSTCSPLCVGSCGHIPLCQTLSATASRGPGAGNAYPLQKALERVDQMSVHCPGSRREGGGTGRQVVKSYLPTSIIRRKSEGMDCSLVSGGAIFGMRYTVPQAFAAGGKRSYLEFWSVTSAPWYPGY